MKSDINMKVLQNLALSFYVEKILTKNFVYIKSLEEGFIIKKFDDGFIKSCFVLMNVFFTLEKDYLNLFFGKIAHNLHANES